MKGASQFDVNLYGKLCSGRPALPGEESVGWELSGSNS